jgi:hypothetical protein
MSKNEEQDEPKRAPGGQKSNKNAQKHGHWARKLKLTNAPLAAISRQNGIGKAVLEKADRIIADHGGRENLSEFQLDLVDKYIKQELLINGIDAWIFSQTRFVNLRKRALHPILLERNKLIETSMKLAASLGLKRESKPTPSLQEYLASKEQDDEQ